ncbi:hypothetical protein B7494_g7109 [Chlorociboria aeruginascens]|nr:hypothetical protein B7494_g7109 [Chlorociboria aeruginascens]
MPGEATRPSLLLAGGAHHHHHNHEHQKFHKRQQSSVAPTAVTEVIQTIDVVQSVEVDSTGSTIAVTDVALDPTVNLNTISFASAPTTPASTSFTDAASTAPAVDASQSLLSSSPGTTTTVTPSTTFASFIGSTNSSSGEISTVGCTRLSWLILLAVITKSATSSGTFFKLYYFIIFVLGSVLGHLTYVRPFLERDRLRYIFVFCIHVGIGIVIVIVFFYFFVRSNDHNISQWNPCRGWNKCGIRLFIYEYSSGWKWWQLGFHDANYSSLGRNVSRGPIEGGGNTATGSGPPSQPSRGMTERRSILFAVPAAFATLAGHKRSSQRTDRTVSSTAGSERGFYRVSGRKLPSVLRSGGDGYGGGVDPDTATLSGTSFYRDSQGFYGGPGSPPLVRPGTRERDSGIPVMRPSPARTPVTEQGPFTEPSAEPPPLVPPRRPDALGRSHPSQDGSHTSRFTEEV